MVNAKKQIQKLIKECDLKEGDVFIDLGSHHGQEIEELIKIGVEVHSFEPHPNISKILKEKYGDNPLVILNEAAAWPGEAGQEFLFMDKDINDTEDGGSTMSLIKYVCSLKLISLEQKQNYMKDHQLYLNNELQRVVESNNSCVVDTINIAEYIKNINKPVNVLKIDVEGLEWNILSHLYFEGILKDIPAIYCEDHETDIVWHEWDVQRKQVKNLLEENNIEIRKWF